MMSKYFWRGLIIFFSFIIYFFIVVVYGSPLHDFNLWILKQHYPEVTQYHPSDAILMAKKSYLGGPDEHGSGKCSYFVGEIIASSESRQQIEAHYADRYVSIRSPSLYKKVPVGVKFFDESWTMESPLGDWWGEFHEMAEGASNNVYLVYIGIEGYPFLHDYRCDN